MTALKRATKETNIELAFSLTDPEYRVKTPEPFLTHMLESFAKHGRFGLTITAGSKDKDPHHLTEDVAITLGQAFRTSLGDKPVKRFAHEVLPMDDALVGVAVDVGGRAYYAGSLPDPLYDHFFRSLAHEAGITLHLDVVRGRDPHHVTEAAFKAVARALRAALEPAPELLSTKGKVETRGR